jgi:hypothetical protein
VSELSVEDSKDQLQAYLNCLELCSALSKQTDEPGVRTSLDALIGDLHEILASLAGYLRQRGVAPGAYGLDRQGKDRIREVLAIRSSPEKLRFVRRSLADLVAWCEEHPPSDETDSSTRDWLAFLSARTEHLLEWWDRQMRELKAA